MAGMPVSSTIDTDQGLVTTRVSGHATAAEVHAAQERLAVDPDFDPTYDHLFDLSDVADLEASADEIRELASVALFSETSRRAVVAPANLLYGLSRMYQAFRRLGPESLQVFRTPEEALQWLQEPRGGGGNT